MHFRDIVFWLPTVKGMEEMDATPRPGWTGFRWGACAGGLYGVLGGGIVGYFAALYEAGSAGITTSDTLYSTLAIFILPSLLIATVLGGIGGAITGSLIYQVLRRMPSITRRHAWLVVLGICLLLMLLVALPVLIILYLDGNFMRGLEESLIVGIPFFIVPGLFYIVAMMFVIFRNFQRWFPDRPA